MKTIKLYFCIVVFILPIGLLAMNHKLNSDSLYLKAMEKVLIKLDSAKSTSDMMLVRNQFERISTMYTKEWLPVYYIAYVDIQMVYSNPKGSMNETILKSTKANIDKLNSFAEADKSEVCTLWGYYYMALTMTDPATNGQKYFNDVFANFEKAISLNPENPRPIYLLAFYESHLPEFIRSERVFCDEINKARELYAKEKKSIEKPYWGKSFLEMIAAKCK